MAPGKYILSLILEAYETIPAAVEERFKSELTSWRSGTLSFAHIAVGMLLVRSGFPVTGGEFVEAVIRGIHQIFGEYAMVDLFEGTLATGSPPTNSIDSRLSV